jgi:hypothetical protein
VCVGSVQKIVLPSWTCALSRPGRQNAAQPLNYGSGDRVSMANSLRSDLGVCVGTNLDSADTVRWPNEENHQAHQQNPARKHEL